MTMRDAAQIVLLLVVLSDLAILGTSRLSSCIRGLAAQGFLLGLLPVLIAPQLSVHAVSLALGTVIVGILWFDEPTGIIRLLLILAIVAAIAALRFTAN